MLNDILAGFQETQAHLNFKDEVVHSVEDGDARSLVRIPVLPLDGEQALELVKND